MPLPSCVGGRQRVLCACTGRGGHPPHTAVEGHGERTISWNPISGRRRRTTEGAKYLLIPVPDPHYHLGDS